MPARLEHVNVTLKDASAFAEMLEDLFDWKVRWEGDAIAGGRSVHVGTEDDYVALYQPATQVAAKSDNYVTSGGLNHIGVVVDDLDGTEAKVKKAGFAPRSHADYEPGKRFYFDGPEGVEIEVVSYAG